MHTCSWFISNDEPHCGAPATHQVTVTTSLYRATVWFCTEHRAQQEANFARRGVRIPSARKAAENVAS